MTSAKDFGPARPSAVDESDQDNTPHAGLIVGSIINCAPS